MEQEVEIPANGVNLTGLLTVPAEATGVVLFVHGSGSGRHSPRNRLVAASLNGDGLATLLIDLLTPREHEQEVFTQEQNAYIELLTRHLAAVADWLAESSDTRQFPLGLFGTGSGAAAALMFAAEEPTKVRALVARGGRLDRVGADRLRMVSAPTLLVVGGEDQEGIDINRQAADWFKSELELMVLPGATRLFEEPGALEEVGQLAGTWFRRYLR